MTLGDLTNISEFTNITEVSMNEIYHSENLTRFYSYEVELITPLNNGGFRVYLKNDP